MVDSQLDPDAAKSIFAATFVFVFNSSAATLCQTAGLMMVFFPVRGQESAISALPLTIEGFARNIHISLTSSETRVIQYDNIFFPDVKTVC